MSEFDPPQRGREEQRVRDVQTILQHLQEVNHLTLFGLDGVEEIEPDAATRELWLERLNRPDDVA